MWLWVWALLEDMGDSDGCSHSKLLYKKVETIPVGDLGEGAFSFLWNNTGWEHNQSRNWNLWSDSGRVGMLATRATKAIIFTESFTQTAVCVRTTIFNKSVFCNKNYSVRNFCSISREQWDRRTGSLEGSVDFDLLTQSSIKLCSCGCSSQPNCSWHKLITENYS